MRKASLLAALLLLAPTVSQAKTLEELLVEKGVITKGEAVSATTQDESARVYYNDGTRFDFPDKGFSLKINTLIQTRYSFVDSDEHALKLPGEPGSEGNGVHGTRVNRSGFDVQSAEVILSGSALYNEFSYKLEGDFVGSANDREGLYLTDPQSGRKQPSLKDAYVTWAPCEEYSTQMGQFKTFVSRQFNTSNANMQFASRTLASDYFSLGWQQGAAQHADLADGIVHVSAGIFNGLSDNEAVQKNQTGYYVDGSNTFVQDTDHTGVLAVRVNPSGKMDPFVESDVDDTEDLATSLGAVYAYSEGHNNVGLGREEDTNIQSVNVDANMKISGFSLNGEYYYEHNNVEHRDGLSSKPTGGYVQGGFFVIPKELELAARYGYIDCDSGSAGGICAGRRSINEAAATINYYWWKHSVKAQFGYFLDTENVTKETDRLNDSYNTNRWVFQLSSYF